MPRNEQVYYHLGEFDDSVSYALGAGQLFDVEGKKLCTTAKNRWIVFRVKPYLP